MIKEIRMSGRGGQGVILAGIILAEAAGLYEGKEVIHAQDYGGQVRGGAVRSDVLIGDPGEEIIYPVVINADILMVLSQEAADRWVGRVKENGHILFDSTYVTKISHPSAEIYSIPLTATMEKEMGTSLGANIMMLGVVCELMQLVSKDALAWAVHQRAPK
ncbi:unnamed protein product, partial [marine sediment metagenome]